LALGLYQSEIAKEGIGSDHSVCTSERAGAGANRDAVAALEVCDGSRGDVADAALEAGAPIIGRFGRTNGIEVEQDVWLRFSGTLAHDRLTDRRALSPMNVSRVVSRAHQLQSEEVLSMTSPNDVRGARCAAYLGRG
jgi:hypothetical protein